MLRSNLRHSSQAKGACHGARRSPRRRMKSHIATDDDREGEAIGWHLAHVLGVDPAKARRIVFREITKRH